MVDVNWSAEAKRDLKAIANYFGSSSFEYSSFLINKIFDTIDELQRFPDSGRKVPELNHQMFRERITEGYRIIYIRQESILKYLPFYTAGRILRKN